MSKKEGFVKGEPFKPLTEGDYLVRMTDCSIVDTKAGTGKMVKACFQVIKGLNEADKGRLIFENFMIEHQNEQAVKIGEQKINHYLKAVGEPQGLEGIGKDFSRLSDYLETPFIATVKLGREYVNKDGKTTTSNTIYTFKSR